MLGKSLTMLESFGAAVAAKTITVFHADHGYQLGELNEWSKKTDTELATRVPMIIRVPWLKASVGQFSETMVAQTRLDIEGEHLARFNWNFGTSSWKDCAFPRVLRPNGVPPSAASARWAWASRSGTSRSRAARCGGAGMSSPRARASRATRP